MYDEKLVKDFRKKYPDHDAIGWYVQYLLYCKENNINDKTYKDYENTMEKVYRLYTYTDTEWRKL